MSAKTEEAGSWIALATLMLATVLANIATVCMFPLIVTLSQQFGRPVNQVVWTLVGYGVVATGVGGVASGLGAALGNRRMLAVALVLLLVGSLIAALSTDLPLLIVGRVFQGVCLSIQALAMGIVANYWRGPAMRRAMTLIMASVGGGSIVAYLLSGFIARSGGDWRIVFWILVGASAVDLLLSLLFLKETPRTQGVRLDYAGCIGLIGWSVLLLLPLSQANSWGWGSGKVLGQLIAGAALVVVWVFWELRCRAPLIDLRVLRPRGAWQGAVTWLFISMAVCVPPTIVPYLVETPVASGFGFGRSLFAVCMVLMTTSLVMAFFPLGVTRLLGALGSKWTMFLGLLLGLGGFGLAFAHGSLWLVVMWLACTGTMPAIAGSAAYVLGNEAVRPEQGILISTIYNTAAGVGASVASAAAGYIMTVRTVAVQVSTGGGLETQRFPADQTFTWSALLVGGAAVAGMLVALTIRTGRMQPVVLTQPRPLPSLSFRANDT